MNCWGRLVLDCYGIDMVKLLDIPRRHRGAVFVRGYRIPGSNNWDDDARDAFSEAMTSYTEEVIRLQEPTT